MRKELWTGLLAGILVVAIPPPALAGVPDGGGEGHDHVATPANMHWLDPQVIQLEDFPAEGHILAVGGGGECILGQLKGRQVIAIDISKRELEDAPGDALKLVMDARDLTFIDGSFDTAASFFTLMYIDGADHGTVFAEIYRVLGPGGRFLVWDASLGPVEDGTKDMVAIPLIVKIPDREVSTGYGVAIPDRLQDLGYYRKLGLAAGFEVVKERAQDRWFHLEFRRPN